MKIISHNYKRYSKETAKSWFGNDGQGTLAQNGLITPDLANMPPGSLACSQLAVLASVLLHDAGVENHYVCSAVGSIRNNGKRGLAYYVLTPGDLSEGHAYVVTQGGAIVEATKSGTGRNAYYDILNGVNARGLVDGRVAITTQSLDGGFIYGSGTEDGSVLPAEVREGQRREVERFNEERQLLAAARTNDLTTVRSLLDRGVYVNTRDEDGHTALYYAMPGKRGRQRWDAKPEIIALLKSRGATLDPIPRRTEPAFIDDKKSTIRWEHNMHPLNTSLFTPRYVLRKFRELYEDDERRWHADIYSMKNLVQAIRSLEHSSDPAVAILKHASRDADQCIRLDDPNNIPVIRKALEAVRDREQTVVDANSSIWPTGLRWGSGVERERQALDKVRFYKAALTELNIPGYEERCRANEERRLRHLSRVAEVESRLHEASAATSLGGTFHASAPIRRSNDTRRGQPNTPEAGR
jgi:hypothetical protein